MPTPTGNTETIENYLKAIYTLARETPTGEAGMKGIATLTGVTVGTASTMVKRMAAAKLARYERFGGVRLTARGERAAVDVIRRHRLIETFLVRTLKLDWSVVHDEAERLEHALSPVVLEALDAFLGHPSVDPHGDPIPDRKGKLREAPLTTLAAAPAGSKVRVARVLDQSEASLRFLQASGLEVDSVVDAGGAEPGADVVTAINARGERVALSTHAAERVLVQPVKPKR